jgi:hypothetical protein
VHGFKVRGYVGAASETRRLMWTLAHAHGTLLSVLNIVFALTLRGIPELRLERPALASRLLLLASVVLPAGFFLGGVQFYAGDPGLGVLLVPVGAALLLDSHFHDRARRLAPGSADRKRPEKPRKRAWWLTPHGIAPIANSLYRRQYVSC